MQRRNQKMFLRDELRENWWFVALKTFEADIDDIYFLKFRSSYNQFSN